VLLHAYFHCRLDDPAKYQSIVDAEWNIIYNKLAKCSESGAQIVLSRLAIGDLGTQYFADRGIFCAGRVPEDDLQRVAKATGGLLNRLHCCLPPKVLLSLQASHGFGRPFGTRCCCASRVLPRT
jgi:T-complex protein 1 subunit eta